VAARQTALTTLFQEESITLRGIDFKFREITGTQYEECIREAEGPDGSADLSTVLRLMIPLSLLEPKWDVEKIYELPLPMVTAIQGVVNRLHFKNEPTKSADPEKESDEAKNDSEPQTS